MDIDFVVLWVDGSDPKWLAEKSRFSPLKIDDSNSINRYRDWGLMKYWFRAVEKFAPWVRTVHFVTWGHLPLFLNSNAPKLHIVNHQDYMPKEYLPTFSANPLELNLHRIPGLADHFVFFNDDMFLLREMQPAAFFHWKTGCPRTQASELPICFTDNEVWQYLVANDITIINRNFSKIKTLSRYFWKFLNFRYPIIDNIRTLALSMLFPKNFYGFKNFHSPAAYCKSNFQSLWEREFDVLHNTCLHKFRNKEDVNQWLVLWWQVASGQFSPRRMRTLTFAPSDKNVAKLQQVILDQKVELICINDPADCVSQEALAHRIQHAFDELLPLKSSFEL